MCYSGRKEGRGKAHIAGSGEREESEEKLS
jgi:hypothetical protein